MTVSIVAARSENDIIGRGQHIPWHLPADLKHFKNLTTGHTIVMGRKTFDSIGRALPKRRTIVITRNTVFDDPDVTVASSLDEALHVAMQDSYESDDPVEIFIIGGGEIYRQAIPRAKKMFLTRVHSEIEGDVRFPEFGDKEWECVSAERHAADAKNAYDYTFEVWERVRRER
jgi:dihydrofolate reductase